MGSSINPFLGSLGNIAQQQRNLMKQQYQSPYNQTQFSPYEQQRMMERGMSIYDIERIRQEQHNEYLRNKLVEIEIKKKMLSPSPEPIKITTEQLDSFSPLMHRTGLPIREALQHEIDEWLGDI